MTMDDRVWVEWVRRHPYDADASPEMRAGLLDTFEGRFIRLDIAGDDLVAASPRLVRAPVRWRVNALRRRSLKHLRHLFPGFQ